MSDIDRHISREQRKLIRMVIVYAFVIGLVAMGVLLWLHWL